MKIKNKKLYIFLTIYFFINLIFLTRFPFMHSDESWLSGLSRNIAENKSLAVTETFFNLAPRYPHAIKSIFHLGQVLFMYLFGYTLFTFRLISLLFSLISIYLFNIITQKTIKNNSFMFTIIFALDIQFIYASHFARQEIIILALFLLAFNLVLSNKIKSSALILGLAIGVHPNAFIISLAIGFYLIYLLIIQKTNLSKILQYIFILASFALVFVLISFYLDPDFINHYLSFGSQFEVTSSFTKKLLEFKNFYLKLYYQVSITYYNPYINVQLVIFTITFALSLLNFKDNLDLILIIIAINLAILIIGRFNPTSIVLMTPIFYLLLFRIYQQFTFKKIFLIFCLVFNIVNSLVNIYPYLSHSYDNYLTNLQSYLDPDSKVLANLNLEYYFDNNQLIDYRNLYYLKENNLTLNQYLENEQIGYIIYSQEMDLIYNTRPIYNDVYGNTYYYYQDLQDFIKNNCSYIGEFEDNLYSIRIVSHQFQENYQVRVYKINNY